MEKCEIISTIKENLAKVIDVDPNTVDEMQPMTIYGANSLDIVDVVSITMRQLKIKVPRTELININNINELATLFHQYNKSLEPAL